MRLLVIDNYDSFTFNLVHLLGVQQVDGRPVELHVLRNDAADVAAVRDFDADAIVLSPGPCTPKEAGICLDVIEELSTTTPMLGVCLGHQAFGEAFGGNVVRAPLPVHGKLDQIRHHNTGLFAGLPSPFSVVRYHSLIVDRGSLPKNWIVTAETSDGLIMGMHHETLPLHGVQFHPESIASEYGTHMMSHFLKLAKMWNLKRARFNAVSSLPAVVFSPR